MKKLFHLFLISIFCLTLFGCSNNVLDTDEPKHKNQEESKSEIPSKPTVLEDNLPTESFFSRSGSGDDIVTGLIVENYSYLKVTANSANRHFAIKAHYDNTYDLLINTTSAYNGGSTLLYPNREYTLEITGTGDWIIEAFKLGTSSTDKFSAKGDYVSPIFICSSDVYVVDAPGGRHFAVKGHHDAGGYDLLVNTTDNYSGKVMLKQKGEFCFFEVTGEREFTIAPSN